MKPIQELLAAYPNEMADHPIDILREYVQYEMLRLIFSGPHNHKFTFLGGTCLRLVYDTPRFSEDIDFDNVGLTTDEFEEALESLKVGMALLDYPAELTFTYKGAYHCAVRFTSLLYRYGFSGHKEARLLIKVDTEKQHYDYPRHLARLSRFGVDAEIQAVPLNLLTSMKIAAVLGRRRPKGRDFFDLSWALELTTPDYGYLEDRFGEIEDSRKQSRSEGIRRRVAEHTADFDFDALALDVKPFLADPADVERVRNFQEMWATVRLDPRLL